jgi:hypothetical protein
VDIETGQLLQSWPNLSGATAVRRASQLVPRDRHIRRKEWQLYAGDLKDFFGHTFIIGNQSYRIEGWIQRNPTNPIYAIRETDGEPFVMSVQEVHTDTQYYALPVAKRRKGR